MRIKIIKILLALVLLAVAVVNVSFAQPPQAKWFSGYYSPTVQTQENQTKEANFESGGDYLKDFISDSKSTLTAPLRWDKSGWIKASLVAGITAGLYACDQDIQDWTQRKRNSTSDKIADFAGPFGDGMYTLPPLGVLYLYGHIFENEKAKRSAWLSLESFVFTGIFTQALKFSTHRHRPSSADPYSTWDGPGLSRSNLSFPSGHASSAFSIATVIANEYDDIIFIPPLAYTIATLTALSRINDNKHWASDVFLGSALGYFTAKAVIGLHNRKENRNLTVQPMFDGEYAGLFVVYKF